MIDTAGDLHEPVVPVLPYDETESQESDESTEVVADWPLLGARVSTVVRRRTVSTSSGRGAR